MQLYQGLTYWARKDIIFFNNALLPEAIHTHIAYFHRITSHYVRRELPNVNEKQLRCAVFEERLRVLNKNGSLPLSP